MFTLVNNPQYISGLGQIVASNLCFLFKGEQVTSELNSPSRNHNLNYPLEGTYSKTFEILYQCSRTT